MTGKIVNTIEYDPSRDAHLNRGEIWVPVLLDYDTISHAREAGEIIIADSYSGLGPLSQKTIR